MLRGNKRWSGEDGPIKAQKDVRSLPSSTRRLKIWACPALKAKAESPSRRRLKLNFSGALPCEHNK